MGDFYPRPPRGGRRSAVRPGHRQRRISIHALREEGDITATSATDCGLNFYPRPPRGGRPPSSSPMLATFQFLSTPSARRATGRYRPGRHHRQISIHALREEGDGSVCSGRVRPLLFLSTPSARRATPAFCGLGSADVFLSTPSARRATRDLETSGLRTTKFLSTPSARRATDKWINSWLPDKISIHALREEGDSKNRDKISIFKQIIQHSARI